MKLYLAYDGRLLAHTMRLEFDNGFIIKLQPIWDWYYDDTEIKKDIDAELCFLYSRLDPMTMSLNVDSTIIGSLDRLHEVINDYESLLRIKFINIVMSPQKLDRESRDRPYKMPPPEFCGKTLFAPGIASFTVGEWCPTPDGSGKPECVAISIKLKGMFDVVLRIKNPQELDRVVQMLLRHKRGVWPEAP